MFQFLPGPIAGVISFCFYIANTVLVSIPLLIAAVFKLLIPIDDWRKRCDVVINGLASCWISANSFYHRFFQNVDFQVSGLSNLSQKNWYLVVSNHRSWTDIIILQKIFNGKIPFLKFFLKKELIYVPIIGIVWWALDFPFMKRYSKKYLEKHPQRKGKDFETTRKACLKFKRIPISVMNFVEGTRFTPEKRARQTSPFSNLLKPKAGGIGYVMSVLGQQLSEVVNVTIVYPDDKQCSFWQFLCGKVKKVKVHVETIPITDQIRQSDYVNNPKDRVKFQQWLNGLWEEKDELINHMREELIQEGLRNKSA